MSLPHANLTMLLIPTSMSVFWSVEQICSCEMSAGPIALWLSDPVCIHVESQPFQDQCASSSRTPKPFSISKMPLCCVQLCAWGCQAREPLSGCRGKWHREALVSGRSGSCLAMAPSTQAGGLLTKARRLQVSSPDEHSESTMHIAKSQSQSHAM